MATASILHLHDDRKPLPPYPRGQRLPPYPIKISEAGNYVLVSDDGTPLMGLGVMIDNWKAQGGAQIELTRLRNQVSAATDKLANAAEGYINLGTKQAPDFYLIKDRRICGHCERPFIIDGDDGVEPAPDYFTPALGKLAGLRCVEIQDGMVIDKREFCQECIDEHGEDGL